MDVETFDFESRITPAVRSVIDTTTCGHYTHGDLWRLVQAWYDLAEATGNEAVGQCAWELSSILGPLAYA